MLMLDIDTTEILVRLFMHAVLLGDDERELIPLSTPVCDDLLLI